MIEISTISATQSQNIRTEKFGAKRGGPVRQTGLFSYKKVRGKPNAGLAPIMACPRGYAWRHREPAYSCILILQKSEKDIFSHVLNFPMQLVIWVDI